MEEGSSKYFDGLAHGWDETTQPEVAERVAEWCRSLALRSNSLVLDVGCGTGASSLACSEQLDQSGMVIGMDRSRPMVEEARRKRGGADITWMCADATQLPIASRVIDVVIAMHLWPHLRQPVQTLREWRRVLKRRGHLLIVHLVSRDEVNRRHRESDSPVSGDRLPPAPELAEVVAECGFRIKDVEEDRTQYLVRATKP